MQKRKLLSVLVRNVDETFRNLFLSLPITAEGEIDFDFMESFIRELGAVLEVTNRLQKGRPFLC